MERSTKLSAADIVNPAGLLFSMDAGVDDHLGPFLRFAVDVIAEMLGRISNEDRALARQLLNMTTDPNVVDPVKLALRSEMRWTAVD